jgi:ABC-type branched-subunit amino acid transport system ATPase component
LPLIAVIGSQSVGKSSLIEAMSGVCRIHICRYYYIVLKGGLADRLTSAERNMHKVCSDFGPDSLSNTPSQMSN